MDVDVGSVFDGRFVRSDRSRSESLAGERASVSSASAPPVVALALALVQLLLVQRTEVSEHLPPPRRRNGLLLSEQDLHSAVDGQCRCSSFASGRLVPLDAEDGPVLRLGEEEEPVVVPPAPVPSQGQGQVGDEFAASVQRRGPSPSVSLVQIVEQSEPVGSVGAEGRLHSSITDRVRSAISQ